MTVTLTDVCFTSHPLMPKEACLAARVAAAVATGDAAATVAAATALEHHREATGATTVPLTIIDGRGRRVWVAPIAAPPRGVPPTG